LHESQGKVLKVLSRINRWYLDDMRKGEVVEDLEIRREDFARMTDVVPVSDPHIGNAADGPDPGRDVADG
jgi:hypothetical protein